MVDLLTNKTSPPRLYHHLFRQRGHHGDVPLQQRDVGNLCDFGLPSRVRLRATHPGAAFRTIRSKHCILQRVKFPPGDLDGHLRVGKQPGQSDRVPLVYTGLRQGRTCCL
jgi:hypothetical protein